MPDRWKYAGGVGVLLLITVLTAAGCGGGGAAGGAPEPDASPEEQVPVDPSPVTGGTALGCGQTFRMPAGEGLTLTVRFPTTVSAGARAVDGTVEVRGPAAMRGVGSPRADAFLVRDGRLVTGPLPQDAIGVRWDVAPGQIQRLPAEATLVSCDPRGGPVPAGTYELYARVMFTPDEGATVESFGGPWRLQVR